MANTANLVTRILAEIFPGSASNARNDASPPANAPSIHPAPQQRGTVTQVAPRTIGRGAANETHITIAGIPNLFVDEGDCIIQFVPAFDEAIKETLFGIKVLPELEPHWSEAATHECDLKQAIAEAIRSADQAVETSPAAPASPKSPATVARAAQRPQVRSQEQPACIEEDADAATPAARSVVPGQSGSDTGAVRGRVVSWGEEKFPDRNKPGRFYDSFAMHVETATGERTLQGEGLKEAIAHARCDIGDYVSVRRLRKIKVPAIRRDGSPKLVDGVQVMWEKWLWSISK